ncbi:MAG TPA: PIN domain-containing protein [Chitinophagaceae bacterium]
MVPKIFLDTNIVIDFLEQRLFDIDYTNQIFTLAEGNDVIACVSETVITNAIYVTGLEDQVLRLLNNINVLCIDSHNIKNAMKSSFKDKEDSILYYGALDNKMDYFITRNKKDFAKHSLKQLPVLSPKELINTMKIK